MKPEQEMLLDAPFGNLEIVITSTILRGFWHSEIILFFLRESTMEVISALLQEKYHVEIELKSLQSFMENR